MLNDDATLENYFIVMPLIYIPFSQKDNLLGLHIYLRTRYSQSKVKVIFTILQFTTFIEWIEKEHVEEADCANFSTKTYWYAKRGGCVVGMVFQNIGTIVVSIYYINLFVFLFSVSARTIRNYHATVTHFHRGGNDLKKLWKLHSTLYIYTAAAVVLWVRGFVPQAEDWVFESQSQQTSVVKTGSDSSIAKRSALGVNATGPRRWPL